MTAPGLGKRKPRIRRNWTEANLKVAEEGHRCRVCGDSQIERAHVIGREFDCYRPVRANGWEPWTVAADRIVPLCRTCHQSQHDRRLDLGSHLTREEEVQAVADIGLGRAYERLMPSQSPKRTSGVTWPD
jgi:hypothetical protein